MIVDAPKTCQICSSPIVNEFSDAVIQFSFQRVWATVCPDCAKKYEATYGVGKGQRYVKQSNNEFEKVEG